MVMSGQPRFWGSACGSSSFIHGEQVTRIHQLHALQEVERFANHLFEKLHVAQEQVDQLEKLFLILICILLAACRISTRGEGCKGGRQNSRDSCGQPEKNKFKSNSVNRVLGC